MSHPPNKNKNKKIKQKVSWKEWKLINKSNRYIHKTFTINRVSSLLASYNFYYVYSALVCKSKLMLTDQNTGEEIIMGDSDVDVTRNTVTFTSEKLKKNRLYSVSVNASNINGSAISNASLSEDIFVSLTSIIFCFMTGTHDIRDVTIDNISHTLTIQYFEPSVATGALIIFTSINEDRSVNFSRSLYLFLDRNASLNYTLPDNLTPGLYRVFAYNSKFDGTLINGVGYPASTKQLYVIGNSQGKGSCVAC